MRLSKSKFCCAIKILWLKILCRKCVKDCIKKRVKLDKFGQMWQIYEICVSFSCIPLSSPKFAQILKYFAQLCDCMIAAYRNSGLSCKLPCASDFLCYFFIFRLFCACWPFAICLQLISWHCTPVQFISNSIIGTLSKYWSNIRGFLA